MIATIAQLLLAPNLIDERVCVSSEPEQVTLQALNEDVDAFEGRCVMVAGEFRGGGLVAGEDVLSDGLPPIRVGLYEREGYSAREVIAHEGGKWVVTGAVDSCRRIAEQVRAEHGARAAAAAAAGKIAPAPPMLAGFVGDLDRLLSARRCVRVARRHEKPLDSASF